MSQTNTTSVSAALHRSVALPLLRFSLFPHLILQGDKNIIRFEGDHNSPRPQFYFDSISIFFNNVLQPPPDDELGPMYIDLNEDPWGTVPDLEDSDGMPGSSDGLYLKK